MRETMKSIAAYTMIFVPVIWNSITIDMLRNALMEVSIKNGKLPDLRKEFLAGFYAGNITG